MNTWALLMSVNPEVTVGFLGLIGCIVTAALTYLAAARQIRAEERKRSDAVSASMQQALNESFTVLVSSLQEERLSLRKEILQMKQEVKALSAHILRLEGELVSLGIAVPERPIIG